MLSLITRHETIVALAALGGILSALAWMLDRRGASPSSLILWCNRAAYALMGTSMLLFVVAGFRAGSA